MVDESNGLEDIGDVAFSVKGKPSINLSAVSGSDQSHLGTLLKQRIEEIRQKQSKETRGVVVTTKGAEFKPENTPYIPGLEHKLLSKHDNATIERNAGYQDRALVHPLYNEQFNPVEKIIDLTPDDIGIESNIDTIIADMEMVTESRIQQASVAPVQPVTQGKQPSFEMKVSRDKMHHGGTFMPNESMPYRPGG